MSRLIFLVLLSAVFSNAQLSKTEIHKLVQKAKEETRAMVTINNKEYFIGSEITVMWVDAVEVCNAFNGMALASLETVEESDAIKAHLTTNNLTLNEFWISLKEVEPSLWMWVGSGQIASFVDFFEGQPDYVEPTPLCILMKTDGWYDNTCSEQRNFICEASTEVVPNLRKF